MDCPRHTVLNVSPALVSDCLVLLVARFEILPRVVFCRADFVQPENLCFHALSLFRATEKAASLFFIRPWPLSELFDATIIARYGPQKLPAAPAKTSCLLLSKSISNLCQNKRIFINRFIHNINRFRLGNIRKQKKKMPVGTSSLEENEL